MESRSRRSDEKNAVRRLTAGATVTAICLNVLLFLQTAMQTPFDVQSTIISAINAFLPGEPRPPHTAPTAGVPGATPIATSRPS